MSIIPYIPGKPMAADLEWNVQTDQLTAGGVAYSSEEAYASFNAEAVVRVVASHFQTGTQIIGHNFIDADLCHINRLPQSFNPAHIFDTKIAAHLIHGHLAETGLLDLGSLVRFYYPTTDWKQMKGDLLEYNGYDNAYTFKLAEGLKIDLLMTDQMHLMEKQQSLARMAWEMEQRGVQIDKEELWKYAKNRQDEREVIKGSFPNLANPNSNPQVIQWASSEFGISLGNCQYETLAKWKGRHPEFDRLIDYRDDTKSLTTWFPIERDKKKRVVQVGERSFPRFNVCGTAVARFSCASPNFQNIPPHLRRFIVPPEGYDMWKFDAKQLENRTVAWHAGDFEALKSWETYDPYQMTASVMFGVAYESVTKQQRTDAKTTELASIYGETPYNLSKRLFGDQKKPHLEEAKRLQGLYFKRRPKVKQWQDEMEKRFKTGEIALRNPFGRMRYVYARDGHEFKKKSSHYMGCSTGADHINGRSLAVYRELGVLPGLLVHDEFACWLPSGEEGARTAKGIKEIFERPIPELGGLIVPVEAKRGPNYGTMAGVDI